MVLVSNPPLKQPREQAMNITSPILTGAANAAELPGDSVTSFLRAFGAGSPDGGLGVIMPSTPTAVEIGAIFGSIFASPLPSEIA